MKILLTAQPHTGKTTLMAKLLDSAGSKQGFITKEIKEGDQRIGFKLVSPNGREVTLAHVNHKSDYPVSRYFVDVDALDEFLEPLFSFQPGQLLYIDEIGQMELFSEKFKKLVELYLDAPNNFLGTITSVYSDEFVQKVKARDDVEIIEVTLENRDQLVAKLRF
jgi:nucleoside-triphosphatase